MRVHMIACERFLTQAGRHDVCACPGEVFTGRHLFGVGFFGVGFVGAEGFGFTRISRRSHGKRTRL